MVTAWIVWKSRYRKPWTIRVFTKSRKTVSGVIVCWCSSWMKARKNKVILAVCQLDIQEEHQEQGFVLRDHSCRTRCSQYGLCKFNLLFFFPFPASMIHTADCLLHRFVLWWYADGAMAARPGISRTSMWYLLPWREICRVCGNFSYNTFPFFYSFLFFCKYSIGIHA